MTLLVTKFCAAFPALKKEYPVFESFDDYDLDENLLRGNAAVAECGTT